MMFYVNIVSNVGGYNIKLKIKSIFFNFYDKMTKKFHVFLIYQKINIFSQ